MFDSVARYFSLLAEPTRLKILHTICHDERSVSSIVAATGATQTNVSRHLSLMHQAGVVSATARRQHRLLQGARPRVRRDLPHRLRAHRGPHRGRRAVEARIARFRRRALGSLCATRAGSRRLVAGWMREARCSQGRAPWQAERQSRRPQRTVPSGCRDMRRLLRLAPRHRSTHYDLRRESRIHPHFARQRGPRGLRRGSLVAGRVVRCRMRGEYLRV